MLRNAAKCGIGRRAAGDEPVATEPARDQRGIGQVAVTDRDVRAGFDEVEDTVCQYELYLDIRMKPDELVDQGRDILAPEIGWRRQADAAPDILAALLDRGLQRLRFLQHALGTLEQDLTLVGGAQIAGGPLQKLDPVERLHGLDTGRHRRRREAEQTPGRRQAACLHDETKEFEV